MLKPQHARVRERLFAAVKGLASGPGTLQQRLTNVATMLIPLRAEDFYDPDAREKFVGILNDLSFVGSAPETAPDLGDEDARAIAGRICDLCLWALTTPHD